MYSFPELSPPISMSPKARSRSFSPIIPSRNDKVKWSKFISGRNAWTPNRPCWKGLSNPVSINSSDTFSLFSYLYFSAVFVLTEIQRHFSNPLPFSQLNLKLRFFK
jgi:hypothetical protein